MSDFFESEIIQKELEEINYLQEKIYGSLLSFSAMSREEKLEHVQILTDLLEKQQVMYTRLSLSDDPKAVEMKENLRKSVALMGFPPETDMIMLFDSMNATIEALKKYIDA
jgi:GTPase Era involved in 16S rRNA processing|tara:strand:+ start:287 stop:619 length:333 start_codon:yes stop_codon:yes gene_type:complete